MTTHGYSTRLCSTRLQHQCMTGGQDTRQRHRCNKTPQRRAGARGVLSWCLRLSVSSNLDQHRLLTWHEGHFAPRLDAPISGQTNGCIASSTVSIV